ncbi:MAG: carbamoyltransferase HypF, partial [Candidatus Methanomethylophilus sp.]|nr:carbamoyltransferase HypF [Methanomethylophilus sp.]
DCDLPAEIKGFSILGSSGGLGGGASIPTDTAICPNCLRDLRAGRRKGYPFTSCTDCGPRFTLLRSLPYDRQATAMAAFPPCPACAHEYADPQDRRFHHQTVCCADCGPHYFLTDRDGRELPGDPIAEFARRLDAGQIGIAKSWGGMHICCILPQTMHMRAWYRRAQKPFAVMVRDIETARKYGDPTPAEERELQSPHRPIVLVHKRSGAPWMDEVSPDLDTVGLFLPYTGMQYLLFDALKQDALIMTSANIPGEPMILDDNDVRVLGADMYLLHNQEIVNRADDSVVRLCGDDTFFIRKSRGSIPSSLDGNPVGDVVGVGAQENLAGAVAAAGRIWPTQHIGDGSGIGVPEYLEQAVRFQMSLVGCRPQVVAEDLHPGYANRRFAHRLAEEHGAELIDVQHHWAHAAALMTDRGRDRLTVISVDGTGYGADGQAWGGEVLSCDYHDYRRVAHLAYLPLLGSERALCDLRRLKFAVDALNGTENRDFTDREASVLYKLMRHSIGSSSLGRVLDTLSYALGICQKRTYDGEPAMKLEPLLARGHPVDGFCTEAVDGVIPTAPLFIQLAHCQNKADAAYSAVNAVMKALTDAACDDALAHGEKEVGITGGCSYDVPIVRMAERAAAARGCALLWHRRVPNGDGGISTGQAAIALRRL